MDGKILGLNNAEAASHARVGEAESTTASDLKTEIVNPLGDSLWDSEVAQHPDCTVFHTSAWTRVLTSTYRHQPVYLRCSSQGRLRALVPLMDVQSVVTGRRGICLPFSDFCSPLLFSDTPCRVIADVLLQMARERRWKYVETRSGGTFSPDCGVSVSFWSHKLDLCPGIDALFAGLKSSVRRALRKAERSDLRVDLECSQKSMDIFYHLQAETRRRHGLPPQPLKFFRRIYQEVLKPGHGFMITARNNHGRPVCAMVYFRYRKSALYKFGASDKAYQEHRPNNLVMWAGIQRLVNEGCEVLHFGRSSLANEGLRRFKLSWGSEEGVLQYFRMNPHTGQSIPMRDRTTGGHTSLFANLPLALNRLAGAMIYPHLD